MDSNKEKNRAEDEYFARIEFDKRKMALEEKHRRMNQVGKDRMKKQHWMHCPKCGMEMVEISFEDIKVDKCSECLGIFFDNGEVDKLIDKNRPGFLSRMASVFKE